VEQQTRNTLPKKERLCGKTSISMLLAKGKHGNVEGLRYLCRKGTGNDVNRFMVSVPKKLFKRAVKRNLLKRRIRESYRKQKHNLTIEGGLDVLFMYSTKEILSYEQIYAAVGQIIDKINNSGKPKKNEQEGGEN
jgi:ribonuclease P protein component